MNDVPHVLAVDYAVRDSDITSACPPYFTQTDSGIGLGVCTPVYGFGYSPDGSGNDGQRHRSGY